MFGFRVLGSGLKVKGLMFGFLGWVYGISDYQVGFRV